MSLTVGRSPAESVRPELRELPEYRLDLSPCRYKLDQNEMPWEVPESIKCRIAERIASIRWSRYPDFHGDDLRRALGEHHGWPPEGILVGNGSNELLSLVLNAVSGPGGEVAGFEPSFGLYPSMIAAAGARPRLLPPREDLEIPIAELLAEARRSPGRPILLCSPNNPTGRAVSAGEVDALADALEAPLLVDNAYGEFSRHDYRPLLARRPNLVLFRTFSKAWALAGFRIGYLLASPELVAELVKVKLPYNLDRASVVAGVAVLESADRIERRVDLVRRRRPGWAAMLARRGLEPLPSEANFHLVRVGRGEGGTRRAKAMAAGLEDRGIRVRDVSRSSGLDGCLRIAVGDGPALRAVDRALLELAGEEGS